MELADAIGEFIPDYPSIDSDNYSYEIARRKAFGDLTLGPVEVRPDVKGTPLKSQESQVRYFSSHTTNSKGLIVHEMGTGKTCVAGLIVEHYKNVPVGGKRRGPAIVLVPRAQLVVDYAEKIVDVCTRDEYTVSTILGDDYQGDRKRAIKHALKGVYKITTYSDFANTLKHLNDRTIRDLYSNTTVIIDEVQHIRVKTDAVVYSNGRQVESIIPGINLQTNQAITRFTRTIENSRIFLLTGTPIWDKTFEFSYILNLFSGEDIVPTSEREFNKMFFDGDELSDEGRMILSDSLKGKVTYLRATESNADRNLVGVSAPWTKHLKIYPSMMSGFQKDGYLQIIEDENPHIQRRLRDASTFIFPGGGVGKVGFNECVKSEKGTYRYVSKEIKKEMRLSGREYEGLRKHSAELASIIQILRERPNELAFIYTDLVTGGGSGAINIALVLQANGFIWSSGSALTHSDTHRRFVVMTSDKVDKRVISSPKEQMRVIERINRPDNRYGSFCQIIIGTGVMAEGISLRNFRQGHVIRPHWNLSRTDQAMGRIYRLGSHDDLPEDERYVNIYMHCSLFRYEEDDDDVEMAYVEDRRTDDPTFGESEFVPELGWYPNLGGYSYVKTESARIYGIAEKKDMMNSHIYREIKRLSWDCALTYKRNVLDSDKDGTRSCDYRECNYVCDGYPQEHMETYHDVWSYLVPDEDRITTNYNLDFSKPELRKIAERVIDLFNVYFDLSLQAIIDMLEIDRDTSPLLIRTLGYIINSRIRIRDRFGRSNFLKESGDIYYLDDDSSITAKYEDSIYVKCPFVSISTDLGDLVEIKGIRDDMHLIKDFCSGDSSALKSMHYRTSIRVLEEAYRCYYGKQITERVRKVIEVLGENLLDCGDDVVHNMYDREPTDYSHGIGGKGLRLTGKIRIFDRRIGNWRYADPTEEERCLEIFEVEKKERLDEAQHMGRDTGYVGKLSSDGKFRVIRTIPGYTGIVCTSLKKNDLIGIMGDLNILPTDEQLQARADKDRLGDKEKVMRQNIEKLRKSIRLNTTMASFVPTEAELKKEISVLEGNLKKKMKKYPSDHKEVKKIEWEIENKTKRLGTLNITGLEHRDIDDLARIVIVSTMTRPELCRVVQEWFESNGYLITE